MHNITYRFTSRHTKHVSDSPKGLPKKISIILGVFIILLFAVLKINPTLLKQLKCRVYAPDQKVEIKQPNIILEIPAGASLEQITQTLVEKQVIPPNKRDAFLCYITKNKLYPNLKAGVFILDKGSTSFAQIAHRLANPNPPVFKVVIPEGLRADQIANIWRSTLQNSPKNNFSTTEFMDYVSNPQKAATFLNIKAIGPIAISDTKTLEGLLFPATYEVQFDTNTQNIIKKHIKAFEKYIAPLLEKQQPNGLTPYQTVILASIIEREATGDYTEKQMIADILIRRLKSNHPLEVDATLLYPKKDWKAPITTKDKQTNSPYNTYKFLGLPPTPISNPGVDAVKAVLNPKPNPYWYYLHGKDGKIHYATTYQEHIQNIYKYLK